MEQGEEDLPAYRAGPADSPTHAARGARVLEGEREVLKGGDRGAGLDNRCPKGASGGVGRSRREGGDEAVVALVGRETVAGNDYVGASSIDVRAGNRGDILCDNRLSAKLWLMKKIKCQEPSKKKSPLLRGALV